MPFSFKQWQKAPKSCQDLSGKSNSVISNHSQCTGVGESHAIRKHSWFAQGGFGASCNNMNIKK